MKTGVVIFPGSNCDEDMVHVLRDVMGLETVKLWHKDTDLQQYDLIVLPGGFSYGDYLRSGAIARFSPIMEPIIRFAEQGGYLLGICNGFQILAEAGLVPGALLHNRDQRFVCKNAYIRVEATDSPLTQGLEKGRAYKIPVAHAEGRYYASPETLTKMEVNGQVLFRYCDADGNVNEESNLNGSVANIAGVCNITRNVFGMMPHPERCAEEILGNTDGLEIFSSLVRAAIPEHQ